MASPHVAAVAAFILSQYPSLTPAQVQEILQATSGLGNGSRIDDKLGFGVVNATRATSLSAALVPTFGSPTPEANGFTVQILNYNNAFNYSGTATASGLVAVDGSGLVTVTGVAASTSSIATINTTKTGYVPGSATTTATSLSAPPAPPAPAGGGGAAAAAAPVAAAPVAAPVAAPATSAPVGISPVVKRSFTLTVDSPAGTMTWIQRKSGTKWVTLKKVTTKARLSVKVSKSGTYRIQIVGKSRKDISKSFKVK
jgi:hypothetical protein